MIINAYGKNFRELNAEVASSAEDEITINNCLGQRYIGAGLSGKKIIINGTPGNALGAYLDGAEINVSGNAQDATGDTMNDGAIYINGSTGDAAGYAMRGGRIYVKCDAGYRAGIHMKAYMEKHPALVIGGGAGSFLGEYQAGGVIIVLGLGREGKTIVGNFCGTGMHGGGIYLRTDVLPSDLSPKIIVRKADKEDMDKITGILSDFCRVFGIGESGITDASYYFLSPDTKNPYKQLYTFN